MRDIRGLVRTRFKEIGPVQEKINLSDSRVEKTMSYSNRQDLRLRVQDLI
jgi:hypothetical protein